MGPLRLAALALAAASIFACTKKIDDGTGFEGPYRLHAGLASPSGGAVVCYARAGGRCDIRVPSSVIAYGADSEFVTASVRRATDASTIDYYFVVRDFDSPRANGALCLSMALRSAAEAKNDPEPEKAKAPTCATLTKLLPEENRPSDCAVRGPFTKAEFDKLRRCQCTPKTLGSDKEKCIPDAVKPV